MKKKIKWLFYFAFDEMLQSVLNKAPLKKRERPKKFYQIIVLQIKF